MKSNEQLQRDVLDAVKWEPLLNGASTQRAEIGVTANDGVVTLTGHVNSYAAKLSAERAAKSVHGVRAVAEELEVRLAGNYVKNDTELAEVAVDALRWNTSVPDDRITVSIENGWVKLEGDVEWQFQKDETRREIEDIVGVKGITNLVTVKPVLKPTEIKGKIERAFQRSATVDASNISVDVNGSLVTLKGTVHSWAERDDAEYAAWAAPGVAKVNDQLTVMEEIY